MTGSPNKFRPSRRALVTFAASAFAAEKFAGISTAKAADDLAQKAEVRPIEDDERMQNEAVWRLVGEYVKKFSRMMPRRNVPVEQFSSQLLQDIQNLTEDFLGGILIILERSVVNPALRTRAYFSAYKKAVEQRADPRVTELLDRWTEGQLIRADEKESSFPEPKNDLGPKNA